MADSLIHQAIAGVDTSDANATAAQILRYRTAYVKGQKLTGTMEPGVIMKSGLSTIGTEDRTQTTKIKFGLGKIPRGFIMTFGTSFYWGAYSGAGPDALCSAWYDGNLLYEYGTDCGSSYTSQEFTLFDGVTGKVSTNVYNDYEVTINWRLVPEYRVQYKWFAWA